MPKLLRQAVADLIDLVWRERVLTGEIVGVLLRHPTAADIGFDGDLGGIELFEDGQELRDFLLPLRREDVIGLHVVDVMPRVRHVILAEYEDPGTPPGLRPCDPRD